MRCGHRTCERYATDPAYRERILEQRRRWRIDNMARSYLIDLASHRRTKGTA